MHGISVVPGITAQESYVFFASANVDEELSRAGGGWTHDVYMARWNSAAGSLGAPEVFISRPEAQEPVSVARSATGNIMVTFEDGWEAPHTVTQRYGVYDASLAPVAAYPQEVEPGGHSGHVSAVGDNFVVFYSDGWIDGGGEQDLGSGYGVYAKVYDAQGTQLHDIDIAHMQRSWWPKISGGSKHAMLLWQEFVPGQDYARLKGAVFDPEAGTVGPHVPMHDEVRYYTYNVAWMPRIQRFLVVGTSGEGGFARLLDSEGVLTASLACMPATVREAGIAVDDKGGYAYTPAADGRLLQLKATADTLEMSGAMMANNGSQTEWRTIGSAGLFGPGGSVRWLSLTESGLKQIDFDPATTKPARQAHQCGQSKG